MTGTLNPLRYYFTRVLQKAGLADLYLEVGTRSRCVIPNPPHVMKTFTTDRSVAGFLSDPSLQTVCKLAKTARTFWDIGANVGLFSILAREANPDLRVVSIEASTDHYQVLCRNWQLDPRGWTCMHVAVGDREGVVAMSRGQAGCDHVLVAGEAAAGDEFRPMLTVDHLAQLLEQDSIDLMKIDVEGMELAVVRGAGCLLERKRVGTIVLESDGHETRYGVTRSELVSFLGSKGYALDPNRSVMDRELGNFLLFNAGASG